MGFKLSQIGDPKNQNKKCRAIHTKDFCGEKKRKRKNCHSHQILRIYFLIAIFRNFHQVTKYIVRRIINFFSTFFSDMYVAKFGKFILSMITILLFHPLQCKISDIYCGTYYTLICEFDLFLICATNKQNTFYILMNEITKFISYMCHQPWPNGVGKTHFFFCSVLGLLAYFILLHYLEALVRN